MAIFLTGKELEDKIGNIIYSAKRTLLIVSPFIKLDDYFRVLFLAHQTKPDLHIIVLFGKNESNPTKSLSNSDFEFFKQFPNISIIYVPTLHGKYYGNESKGILTSINFYDKSFEKNIEFGIYTESSLMDTFESGIDKSAWAYCNKLANENDIVFLKRPVFNSKIFGLSKNLVGSEILFDQLDKLITRQKLNNKRLPEFPPSLEYDSLAPRAKPVREYYGSKNKVNFNLGIKPSVDQNSNNKDLKSGYCIRCRAEIDFSIHAPYCIVCFREWVVNANEYKKEKYCHSTGQESFGKTSKNNPVLKSVF